MQAPIPDFSVNWERHDATFLDEAGLLRVLPAATVLAISPEERRAWCWKRGIYLLPTIELVDWLRGRIGPHPAIEIAAGNGALGRALRIRSTDAYYQTGGADPDFDLRALSLQCAGTQPASDVERLEAVSAARRYRPHTVVAAWATHQSDRGPNGYWRGVDEGALLKLVRRYIFIGSVAEGTGHSSKPILTKPHEEHEFPWLVSRSYPGNDRIWIWNRRR